MGELKKNPIKENPVSSSYFSFSKCPSLFKQRHLPYALGAVVLVGAGVGFQAVLACWGGGFAVAEDFLHDGDVAAYGVRFGGKLFGKVNYGKTVVGVCCFLSAIRWGIGVHNAEGVDWSAVGDDVVLQGGVAAVGLAEGAARLHLVGRV